MKESVKTILMHGPGITDPSKIVEREVPECDVQAYKAAGYVKGAMPVVEKVIVYTEADAIAQNDGEDATKPKPKAKKK